MPHLKIKRKKERKKEKENKKLSNRFTVIKCVTNR